MSDSLLSKSQMSMLMKIAIILAAVGAINWYTTVIMHRNLVNTILQNQNKTDLTKTSKNENIIYALIGAAGLLVLYGYFNSFISMHIQSAAPHW
jgi:uncharacterized membrane protein YuzA (DUF378 family)